MTSETAQSKEYAEPILRSLEYNFQRRGYKKINDEFMLGEDILVAPVLNKGHTQREVVFPEGKWVRFDGKECEGGMTVKLNILLSDISCFVNIAKL